MTGDRDGRVTATAFVDGQYRSVRQARPCGAIGPDGKPCATFTLHERCLRHRRQAMRRTIDDDDGYVGCSNDGR